ncbi:DUF4267 domain-containing protein [Nonomuraea sp. NPDC049309]|uniref:DUF4267 domain-containing protein n=1 Tax=Nonomuraea sp. NPDC049309 TaxID=3364350 RepID=UPI003715094C
MLTAVAYGLAIAINLLCLLIGIRFLFTPYAAATAYGVSATTDRAYLTIKGVRDGTYGVIGLALLAFAGAQAEAWFLLGATLAPLSDTFIVLRNGGTKATAYGIHFATAIVLLIDSALLFAV